MNDSRFPWCILVPKIPSLIELDDLNHEQRLLLLLEIETISKAIKKYFDIEKINIGSLGNIVSQLHIHVVGRSQTDEAWPAPVWGFGKSHPYSEKSSKLLRTDFWEFCDSAI
jgi:diadenosine tetraphosphate (Ap4A) HIT family hydrolase